MQSLAQAGVDFSMDERFGLLCETEGNLKLIWELIYLCFIHQELLMLELQYKHPEDFSRSNAFQMV